VPALSLHFLLGYGIRHALVVSRAAGATEPFVKTAGVPSRHLSICIPPSTAKPRTWTLPFTLGKRHVCVNGAACGRLDSPIWLCPVLLAGEPFRAFLALSPVLVDGSAGGSAALACMGGPLPAEVYGEPSFSPVTGIILSTLCRRYTEDEERSLRPSVDSGRQWWARTTDLTLIMRAL
jgi:hypothetical protein